MPTGTTSTPRGDGEVDVGADEGHGGAQGGGDGREGITLPAGRAVPEVAHRVQGLAGPAGRDDDPQTRESVDQRKIEDTTNIVDVEDAIKYMPSIFVRKRNFGDTQPTFQTRMWGINSSARNLVFVDDVPISALISNRLVVLTDIVTVRFKPSVAHRTRKAVSGVFP